MASEGKYAGPSRTSEDAGIKTIPTRIISEARNAGAKTMQGGNEIARIQFLFS